MSLPCLDALHPIEVADTVGRPAKPHLTSMGYWRATIAGKRVHLGKDKNRAQVEFHRLMAEAGMRRDPLRPEFLADAVRQWHNRNPGDDRSTRLEDFLTFAGARVLSAISNDLLHDYYRFLKRRKLAINTMRDRMGIAQRVLRWLHTNEWIGRVPEAPRLPRALRKARDLSPSQLQDIFEGLPFHANRILRFIAYTGCRPIEARHLRWSDVDLGRGVCIVNTHKTAARTGEPRTIFLTVNASAVLKSIERDHEFVFLSRLGKPYSRWGFRTVLSKYDVTPYQLRHTFAQIASEQISEEELARLMGHKSVQTTRFYYDVRDVRAKKAASTLTLPELAQPPEPHQPKSAGASSAKSRTRRPRRANRKVS